jgi:hypothetical protein
MLAHTSREPDEVIALVAPAFGVATFERIAINAVLAGAGYNFRRLIAWLRRLWRVWFAVILANLTEAKIPIPACAANNR